MQRRHFICLSVILLSLGFWNLSFADQKMESNHNEKTRLGQPRDYLDVFIQRDLRVKDAAHDPMMYMGKTVDWFGKAFCREKKGSLDLFLVNENDGHGNVEDMEHSFGIAFTTSLPNDRRIGVSSFIRVRGKIIGFEKLHDRIRNIFSRNRQPIVEPYEVTFQRKSEDQELIIRF